MHKRAAGVSAKADRASSVGAPVAPASDSSVVLSKVRDFGDVYRAIGLATDKDWELRENVLAAYRSGDESHLYADHYDAIWAGRNINILGGRDGWSEADVRSKLDDITSLRESLVNGELPDNDIFPKDTILEYLDVAEEQLNEGIETKGRSLGFNAAAANTRHIDFDLGRNRS